MTNFSSIFSSANAAEILALANSMDTSAMDEFQLAEFHNAVEALKEQMRIDKEYTEDVPAPAPKAEAPKHTLKDASNVGCTTLIDTAFVPEAGEDPDDGEIIVAAANAIVDDDDEVVVQKGFRGDPEDGMHQIILVDYPERQQGKNGNGDYRVFHFRDVKLCNEWTMVVGEADLAKRLQEISYNNKGMLAGMTKKRAFASLMVNPVSCWTLKNLKGRVVTYFDEVAYTKYFTWVQTQKSDKEFAYATKHSAKILAEDKAASFAF